MNDATTYDLWAECTYHSRIKAFIQSFIAAIHTHTHLISYHDMNTVQFMFKNRYLKKKESSESNIVHHPKALYSNLFTQ